jgi:hypothetical protein
MYLYIRDIHLNSVYIVGGHMYLYIKDIHFNSVYIVSFSRTLEFTPDVLVGSVFWRGTCYSSF